MCNKLVKYQSAQSGQLATKPHYPILDGLRGVAAIMVALHHVFWGKVPHGYLAVDFFFLLSGFVIGYAYDDRWGRMGVWEFFKIRLIRLHPLIVLSVAVCGVSYWFDPAVRSQPHASLPTLLGVMLMGMTLLPTPDIRGSGYTHSLNGAMWSLLQEYIANIIYALLWRRLSKHVLLILLAAHGIMLVLVAARHGHIDYGVEYEYFWVALIRMSFSFLAGIVLFRFGKYIRVPVAFPICSLILIVVFASPILRHNGIFEMLCVLVFFPVVVAMGAGGNIRGHWAVVCKFLGDISYPVYLLHCAFLPYYSLWVSRNKPFPIAAGWALIIFVVGLAYASLKLYDEPVRNWLKAKFVSSGRDKK